MGTLLSMQGQRRKKMSEGWVATELSDSAWLALWRRVKRQEGCPLYKQLEERAHTTAWSQ